MKMAKTLLVYALVLSLCLSFAACGGGVQSEAVTTTDAQPAQSSLQEQTADAQPPESSPQEQSTGAPPIETEAPDPYASAGVGDTVSFGAYEQDNDPANGEEPIEWIVLEKDGSEFLLLSRRALDARPFNLTQTDATWETCTLRQWLNEDFFQSAFSASEQAQILDSVVTGDANPSWGTTGGADTTDRVYILSMVEAQRYTGLLSIGQCSPTAYASSREVLTMSGKCWWWTRTGGSSLGMQTYVDQDGDVSSSGRSNNFENGAVRPVIRANLAAKPNDPAQAADQPSDLTQPDGYQVGSVLRFGRYEQDNNLSTGPDPIEWTVLKRDGDMALLLSLYGLDQQPYNESYAEVTWESCTLRQWLNEPFLNSAFSPEELGAILDTVVAAEDNPRFGTAAGSDTVDKVFLLSLTEAEYYLDTQSAKQLSPTAYAEAQGVSNYKGHCSWWLRSPGQINATAAFVYDDGSVLYPGCSVLRSFDNVFKDDFAVRPAIWVDLSAIN